MLRFYGFFKESVVESRLENMRVRKLTIFYYLEDKSIMITEPKQVNSGVPQGPFLKRQVCLKADGRPYMPDDFAIGTDQAIFGRAMRIYDVDEYTRKFYAVSPPFRYKTVFCIPATPTEINSHFHFGMVSDGCSFDSNFLGNSNLIVRPQDRL